MGKPLSEELSEDTLKSCAMLISEETLQFYDANKDRKLEENEQQEMLSHYTKWVHGHVSQISTECMNDLNVSEEIMKCLVNAKKDNIQMTKDELNEFFHNVLKIRG
jgi:hypothetical protein